MTGTGRKGSAGHFHRVGGDDASLSFCGLRLLGGRFTDAGVAPRLCLRCLRALQKAESFEHYHLVFDKDCWWVRWTRPAQWFNVSTTLELTSVATKCSEEGCTYMIPCPIAPWIFNTGTGTTYTYSWAP